MANTADTSTPPPGEDWEARFRARHHPVEIDWFDAGHTGSGASAELAIGQTRRIIEFGRSVIGRGAMM